MITSFDLSRFALPGVILLAATSLVLLVSNRWRWCLFALALQYAGVFLLVALNWPFALAAVKVVAGWMAGLVLATAVLNSPDTWERELGKPTLGERPHGKPTLGGGRPPLVGLPWRPLRNQPGGALFRLLAAGLVAMVVASIAPRVAEWMPGAEMEQVWGGLILIGIGLLHLGLTAQPLRVVFGLLTVLSGFEILYAAVESAKLVAGLLAGVNLGLALVGAYLLASPSLEDAG